MGQVDRLWRLFATGLSFVLFGLGGLILALLVFPIINIVVADPDRREAIARGTVHRGWRLYIGTLRAMGVLSWECHGSELLRDDEGTIIVCNHPTLLDVVFLMSLLRNTQCVVKAGVWNNPFFRGVVRAANYIPNVGDPERLIRDCAGALRQGNNIVIFPEGSRTVPGEQRRISRGFAHAALLESAPIRLVTIDCSPVTLLKGQPWYHIPQKRPHWTIRIHERIDTADVPEGQERAVRARQLCTTVYDRFEEILGA